MLKEVLRYRSPSRGQSTKEIAAALGVKSRQINVILGNLEREGLAHGRRVKGVYRYVAGWKA